MSSAERWAVKLVYRVRDDTVKAKAIQRITGSMKTSLPVDMITIAMAVVLENTQ